MAERSICSACSQRKVRGDAVVTVDSFLGLVADVGRVSLATRETSSGFRTRKG